MPSAAYCARDQLAHAIDDQLQDLLDGPELAMPRTATSSAPSCCRVASASCFDQTASSTRFIASPTIAAATGDPSIQSMAVRSGAASTAYLQMALDWPAAARALGQRADTEIEHGQRRRFDVHESASPSVRVEQTLDRRSDRLRVH